MNKKVTVSISRGEGQHQLHEGVIIGETNSHYQIQFDKKDMWSEWFAKRSQRVNCHVIG